MILGEESNIRFQPNIRHFSIISGIHLAILFFFTDFPYPFVPFLPFIHLHDRFASSEMKLRGKYLPNMV